MYDHRRVLDAAGAWLGRVALPHGFTIHEIASDYLPGVLRHAADVERVVLYGLERTTT